MKKYAKKQVVRKQYNSQQKMLDLYICEYDASLFQELCLSAQALILYIIATVQASFSGNSKCCFNWIFKSGRVLVTRHISIAIDRYLLQVRIVVPVSITNPRLLHALTVYNLAHSPTLQQLPRWMARQIRQRARHIHFVSTALSFDSILSTPVKALVSGNKSSCEMLFMTYSAEIVSLKRIFANKNMAAMHASNLTALDIPSSFGIMKPYIPLVKKIPEHRLTFIYWFQQQDYHRTALFLTILFICLEKMKPGFRNSRSADKFCHAAFIFCMLPHVVVKAFKQTCSVLKEAYQPASYKKIEEIPPSALPPAPKADGFNAANLTETIPFQHDIMMPEKCTCTNCRKIKPIIVKPSSKRDVFEINPSAADASAEKKNADHGNVSRAASTSHASNTGSSEQSSGIKAFEESAASQETVDADSIFRTACASVYGGFVPPIVSAVHETKKKGRKTTSERRQINRHNSNIPALSVQSLLEFQNIMFPGCYITDFSRAQQTGENDVIYLHSWQTEFACPCCGKVNTRIRDNNTASLCDMPIRNGIGLQIKVTLGRSVCQNEACPNYNQTYIEKCDFADPGLKYTKRAYYQMLVAGASSNFTDTSRQMKLMGIPCCEHVISQLIMSLQFKDEANVKVIGIDDVSYLKGRKYMTAIYSLETGHLLKLLPGRNGEGLDAFLDAHPNVSVICRDRSSAYGKLIRKYIEKRPERGNIMQVADRFHLMQNCSDNLRKAYYKSIPYQLAIDLRGKEPVLLEKLPEKKAVPVFEKPENVSEWFYENTPYIDENGTPVEFTVVIDQRSPREIVERQEESEAEYSLIRKIRQDYADMGGRFKKDQKQDYLEKHHITYSRFLKYVHMTDEEVEAVKSSWKRSAWREKSFDHFKHIVYKMLKDNHSINDIYWYIKEGNNGSWDNSDARLISYIIETYKFLYPQKAVPDLKQFITMTYDDGILVAGRQRLFYALMTLDETKKDKDLAPCLEMICKAYPVCKTIQDTFKDFHDCIIAASSVEDRTDEKRQKCIENLDAFIEKHKNDALCGFVSHLNSDLECIKNAILTDYHSGGVEGRNLRIKCYERMSFGKGKLETLENRLKLGFQYTDESFSVANVAPWLVETLEDSNAASV